MSKRRLNIGLTVILFLLLGLLASTTQSPKLALSATTHVVISEVQIGAADADDEFVELYNPTESSVELTGWRLTRRTATGTQSNLVASLSGTIAAHGYFLITSPEAATSNSADLIYSTSTHLAASNSAVLYSDAGTTQVDLVGMGTATANETTATQNPPTGGSIERKANSSATETSMEIGGLDEFAGNGEDSDNNVNDFIVRTISQPQNSLAAGEPVVATATPSPIASASPSFSPTPSATPIATPESSPTPNPTASPTVEPTVTPVPSTTPSPTVEPSVSPTVTPLPTATPSATPAISPSATPRPSASPTVSPTPSPSSDVIFNGMLFTCRVTYRTLSFRFFSMQIPQIRCQSK